MYLKFKAKNRTFEDRIPFDGLTTRIRSGTGWLRKVERILLIEQVVFGREDMLHVTDVDTLFSDLQDNTFANFIILEGDDGVRHSYAWDRNEYDVFQENDDGKTVARY